MRQGAPLLLRPVDGGSAGSGKLPSLVTLVDRYGRAIEADFHALNVDLVDFFRGRHAWTKFWRLLSQLGADSRYVKAQQNDPEVAEYLASREKPDDPAWRPQSADWSLLHELLAINNDRLGHVAALLADLPVGVTTRHTPPSLFPRPETELDRVRRRLQQVADQAYDDRLADAVSKAKARWRAQNPDVPPTYRKGAGPG